MKYSASLLLLLLASGCNPALTRQEAEEALTEVEIATQASALTSNTVEISTNFTIGEAVEVAAEQLRSFVASQLPCAEITVDVPTVSIVYGANGACPPYNGHTLQGTHRVTLSATAAAEVIVDHVWEGLSDGRVALDGAATVTWSLADPSRRVEHTLEWTRLSDGRQGVGSGDRVQRPLAEGLREGIQIDGDRDWEGESGDWHLDIDAVQVHWRDPVPRSGMYTLDTPFDKSVSLGFSEVDAATIRVHVESGRREYDFDVRSYATP